MSTNFPDGVTNVTESATLGSFVNTDPTKAHTWFDDFDSFTAANWTVTETQAGATQGVVDGDGGILALVNSAADDDLNAIQWSKETFKFEAGKRLWFKARFKVSDATQSDLVIGLQITDTTPLAVTDGTYFVKADGSTSLSLVVTKNSTATTTTGVATLADNTYVSVGFVYDGASKIDVYVNDVRVKSSVTTNLCDDEDLTVSIAVQNGEAAAKTLSVDYVFVAKER